MRVGRLELRRVRLLQVRDLGERQLHAAALLHVQHVVREHRALQQAQDPGGREATRPCQRIERLERVLAEGAGRDLRPAGAERVPRRGAAGAVALHRGPRAGAAEAGVAGAVLHGAQRVAGGPEAGHVRRAVEVVREDALGLVVRHPGRGVAGSGGEGPRGLAAAPSGGAAWGVDPPRVDGHAALVDAGGAHGAHAETRRVQLRRRSVGAGRTSAGHQRRRGRHVERRRLEQRVGRPRRVAVVELLAGDLGSGAVGHGVTVRRRSGARVPHAERPERGRPRAEHGGRRQHGVRPAALHVEPHRAPDTATFLDEAGDHDALDEPHPGGQDAGAHGVPRVHELDGASDRARLVVVRAAAARAPPRELEVALVGFVHQQAREVQVGEVLAGQHELAQVVLAAHTARVGEDEERVRPGGQTRASRPPLDHHDHPGAGLGGAHGGEAARVPAADHEHVGVERLHVEVPARSHAGPRGGGSHAATSSPSRTTPQSWSEPSTAPSVTAMARAGQNSWQSRQAWQSSR